MSLISSMSLFFLSFAPLWLSVLFIDIKSIIENQTPLYTEWISIVTIIIFTVVALLALRKSLSVQKRAGIQKYRRVAVEEEKTITAEYLLSYILPLFAFDFTQWQDMIKFLIIWGFLFLLCWRFWQMPIAWLSMLGFFVSECDLETYDGQLVQKIIISRKPLSRIKGELVTIADIDNNQAIQIGEHLD